MAVLVPPGHMVEESFSAEQFRNALEAAPSHFWFAARNRLIGWAIRRFFSGARTLLEVGCGTGQVLQSLTASSPHLKLTGLEGSLEGLSLVAPLLPGVELLQADVTALPFDSEFDLVGAFDVLEHIPDDESALREIARSASAGGGVLLTVPQHPWLWSAIDDYSGHCRRYTRASLLTLVRQAGLTPLFTTSFVTALLPAMVASRLAQRKAQVDPMREFRISTTVNHIAGALMSVEHRIIAAGVRLPAGGSLLCVARRDGAVYSEAR